MPQAEASPRPARRRCPAPGQACTWKSYDSVFSSLPIPVSSQRAPQAVSPALNYTQAYYGSRHARGRRPPLFHLADDQCQFSLLFAGA